jgi:Na+/proline symporter
MPHGLLGLVVAAIVAATMSTHSGAINSLAAATTMDIWVPLTKRPVTDAATYRAGKLFALMWGIVLTGGALLYPESKTPVVVVALSIASFTYGALVGAFFLGIYNSAARQRDAILAMSVGIVVMAVVVFSPSFKIAWPWYVLIGTTITFLTGSLSALRKST